MRFLNITIGLGLALTACLSPLDAAEGADASIPQLAAAQEKYQAARMINEDTPAVMCIEAPGFSGETLAFAAELAASAPDAVAALNDAVDGVSGYTASDVSCAAPSTTASPSPEPTDGPTESAPPTRSPATSPTASPVQLCHGDVDLGICDM